MKVLMFISVATLLCSCINVKKPLVFTELETKYLDSLDVEKRIFMGSCLESMSMSWSRDSIFKHCIEDLNKLGKINCSSSGNSIINTAIGAGVGTIIGNKLSK